MKSATTILSILCLTLAIGAILCGCEGSTTNPGITVTPATATLTNGTGAVMFTASIIDTNRVLFFPLEWQVTDPSLGRISSSVGLTAIYEGLGGSGNNAVTVRDQSDSEGVALVSQF